MATMMQDTAHEKRAMSSQVEAVGRELTRYGLVVVVGWIGLMKFTTYEAEGIRPFVANSPLMSWVYKFMSVQGFSAMLGVVEVTIALLIAARPFSPRVSALGNATCRSRTGCRPRHAHQSRLETAWARDLCDRRARTFFTNRVIRDHLRAFPRQAAGALRTIRPA